VQVASALQPPLLLPHLLMAAVAAAHVRPMQQGHARGQALPPFRQPMPLSRPACWLSAGASCLLCGTGGMPLHPLTCSASEAIASEARLAGAGAACGGDTAGGVGAAASVVLRTHVDTCISVLKIIIVKATCAARGQARRWVLALPPHGPADCCGLAKPTQLEQYCQAEDTVDQLPVCLALQEPGSPGRQQMTRQALFCYLGLRAVGHATTRGEPMTAGGWRRHLLRSERMQSIVMHTRWSGAARGAPGEGCPRCPPLGPASLTPFL